jgi:hypothetical protein
MAIEPGHITQCGHVVSARLTAVLGILRGYAEADEQSAHPVMSEPVRKFLMQLVTKGTEAIDEYHDVWGDPSVMQLLEGTEFVSKLWER